MLSADFLIIGAGISGLMCAHELQKAGFSVQLVDKGYRSGGRMATRQFQGGRFDYGAQYFTVRDSRFQKHVDCWLAKGVVKVWFSHLPEDTNLEGHPRYCGVEGMRSISEYLSDNLNVATDHQVVELVRDTGIWIAKSIRGGSFSGKHLIITAPLPQALGLLELTGLHYASDELDALRDVRYEKGLATLLMVDRTISLPEAGGIKTGGPVLSWLADNTRKGISSGSSAVTLHATSEFAAEHWDTPDEIRGPLMIEAAQAYLQGAIHGYRCHRWGFTTAAAPFPRPCFLNEGLQLSLAGDSFGSPRIEGAALSGLRTADALLEIVQS